MARQPLRVLPLPLDLAYNDPEENLKRVDSAVAAALRANAGIEPESVLFVFPEATLTGFVTESPRCYRVSPPDEAVSRLREIARSRRTGLVAGFPEKDPAGGKPFNASLLIGPDGEAAAHYRKLHLFTFGAKPESGKYQTGRAGTLCLYRGWRVALSICFDARFARLYHAYARAGAELIVVSSCWVGGPHKTYQYRTLGSAHAVLAQAYVCAVNRAGRDPDFEYDGSAYVFSPFGEDVFSGGPVELDAGELASCRALVVRPSDRDDYPLDFDPAAG